MIKNICLGVNKKLPLSFIISQIAYFVNTFPYSRTKIRPRNGTGFETIYS